MKVAVIGGGSSYTPELVNGFLERVDTFPGRLWLVNVLPERLATVGGFAQRMAHAKGDPFRVVLTTDRHAAIAGASYVTTQLRVGWIEARRQDEYLGKRYGLVGQETTGVGGMAKALRTIPVLLAIARDMAELAPDALLVNFTNPAGLVTEALARYAPDVQAVGVCNVPITAKMLFLERWQAMTGIAVAAEHPSSRRWASTTSPGTAASPSTARTCGRSSSPHFVEELVPARPRLGAAPRRVPPDGRRIIICISSMIHQRRLPNRSTGRPPAPKRSWSWSRICSGSMPICS